MRLAICLFLLGFFVGCGPKEGPKLIPVNGQLKVDGKPLENIAVQLIPVKADKGGTIYPPSVGVTDEDGKFVMRSSSGNRGVPAGKYKVVLASYGAGSPKKTASSDKVSPEELAKQQYESMQRIMAEMKKSDKDRLKELPFPKEFANEDTTPRELEVTNQSLTLDLDL